MIEFHVVIKQEPEGVRIFAATPDAPGCTQEEIKLAQKFQAMFMDFAAGNSCKNVQRWTHPRVGNGPGATIPGTPSGVLVDMKGKPLKK